MIFVSTYKNYIVGTIILVTLFGGVGVIQYLYDKIVHPKYIFTTETKYIMPSKLVKNFSFGFNNVLADFYWVNIIQDYSIWDGKDIFYLHEYENVSALDPYFSYPYLLGILTYTSRASGTKGSVSDIETIEQVSLIGMKNLPENWEIPYYLGTAFQIMKVTDKALYYLKIAADKKDAPPIIKSVYTSYVKNIVTGNNASHSLVDAIYKTTTSKTTKDVLKESFMADTLRDILQGVVTKYKRTYGIYPSSTKDLAVVKMIRVVKGLEDVYLIIINPDTGKVTVTARKK